MRIRFCIFGMQFYNFLLKSIVYFLVMFSRKQQVQLLFAKLCFCISEPQFLRFFQSLFLVQAKEKKRFVKKLELTEVYACTDVVTLVYWLIS